MVGVREVVVAAVSSIVAPVSLRSQNRRKFNPQLIHRQIILLCIYRLTLHPYAKYPGPILAKLTSLRAAYYAHTGDMHLDIERCHQKYGESSTQTR